MPFVPLVAALALIAKLVDFVKLVTNRSVNGVVTQLAAWGFGVGVFFLLSRTDFAGGIAIGSYQLNQLNGFSLMLVGLTVSSAAGLVVDFKQARDNTDSAVMPPLLPNTVTDGPVD